MAKMTRNFPEAPPADEFGPDSATRKKRHQAGIEAPELPRNKSREELLAEHIMLFVATVGVYIPNRALVSLAVRRGLEALRLLPVSAGPVNFLARAIAVAAGCCDARNDEDAAASIPAAGALLEERALLEKQERDRVGCEAIAPAESGLTDDYALAKHLLACVLHSQDESPRPLADEAAEVAIQLLLLRQQGQPVSIRLDLQQTFEKVVRSDLVALCAIGFVGPFSPDDPHFAPLWGGSGPDQEREGTQVAGSLTTGEETGTVDEVINPPPPERKDEAEDAGSPDLSSATMPPKPKAKAEPLPLPPGLATGFAELSAKWEKEGREKVLVAFQALLAQIEGREFGSFALNKAVAQEVNQWLDRLNVRFACSSDDCGHAPARLRCRPHPDIEHGTWQFEHFLKPRIHGGTKEVPQLKLVPAPLDRRLKSSRSS
jgi:hypothetical protein